MRIDICDHCGSVRMTDAECGCEGNRQYLMETLVDAALETEFEEKQPERNVLPPIIIHIDRINF